jgi:hypothetical protein
MKNKAKYFSRIKWFCITVIVTVLALIVLPSLPPFFVSKVCARSPVKASTAKILVSSLIRGQQAYYLEHGHFMSSTQPLEGGLEPLGISRDLKVHVENNWEISIQTKDDIAFAYAVAKDANQKLYSYVAATTAYGKTDNDRWIICRTLEPSTAQPAAPILQESQQFIFWRQDAQLVCSSGTENC